MKLRLSRKWMMVTVLVLGLPLAGLAVADRLGFDLELIAEMVFGKGGSDGETADLKQSDKASDGDDSTIVAEGHSDGDGYPPKPEAKDGDEAAKSKHDAKEETAEGAGDSDPAEAVADTREPFDPQAHDLPEGEDQPWRLFRELQIAQHGILEGHEGALEAYRQRMHEAAETMVGLPIETWHHRRNLIAAAGYTMSGGRLVVADKIISQRDAIPHDLSLLEAAHAFASGQYYRAYNLLYPFEPAQLPLSVAGQVALVKAMLLSPRDLERAREQLDEARRLAGGTLVDEAAIRRQVRVFSELERPDELFQAARTYLRRYRNSLYRSDFLRNLASGVLRLPDEAEPRAVREVAKINAMLDDEARQYFLMLIARGATVFGRTELARLAVEEVMTLDDVGQRDQARLELYSVATSLVDPDRVHDAAARLDQLKTEALGIEDQRLGRAVVLLAEQILMPHDSFGGPQDLQNHDGPTINASEDLVGPDAITAPVLPVLAKAEELLDTAEKLGAP